ncbi:hypothetical protein [Vibrio alginolyticus]|uniref:hypothetical protein n=1 Tax=Vibrio alginolyticus TaxID=663 RepID=UPI0007203FC2|nr:hypothetical protein [Vibrio alginolyticus]ALR91304.1 hypothetical protein AT730_02455 [Vibrio alginolyticus]MBY7707975.1 hypothetical protein [Vibrio alginolyticus]
MYLYPYTMAENLLEWFGIDFERIYNERGGMQREQLKLINKYSILMGAKSNAYMTIKRLEKSKNKSNLDFAANIQNTMTGTLSSEIVQTLAKSEHADEMIIEWQPSSSKHERRTHALHYGQRMTIKQAERLGLGVEYNCQCGMKLISGQKHAQQIVNKINRGKSA